MGVSMEYIIKRTHGSCFSLETHILEQDLAKAQEKVNKTYQDNVISINRRYSNDIQK